MGYSKEGFSKLNQGGLFITLEGTEGSGKSTLLNALKLQLEARSIPVLITREPGGSPLAESIRALVLHHEMPPKAELFLYEAARAEHLANTILPALKAGRWVLCDRFTDSTLAYQGSARGLPWKEVQAVNRIATDGLLPHWTIWLDIDPAEGLRAAKDPNRFEAEGVAFQRKVRKGFERARMLRPRRWIKVKGHSAPAEVLAQEILSQILKPLARSGRKAKGSR